MYTMNKQGATGDPLRPSRAPRIQPRESTSDKQGETHGRARDPNSLREDILHLGGLDAGAA
eukprot:12973546-Alexandrium_andersonii.AAC.1